MDDPSYCDLAEVIEWRRNAWLDAWVPFASGNELNSKQPVVALVRGWERLGLVEIAADEELGYQRHRFRRLPADFPAGFFDRPAMLPQPPALRDPKAVGLGMMAYFALQGDDTRIGCAMPQRRCRGTWAPFLPLCRTR